MNPEKLQKKQEKERRQSITELCQRVQNKKERGNLQTTKTPPRTLHKQSQSTWDYMFGAIENIKQIAATFIHYATKRLENLPSRERMEAYGLVDSPSVVVSASCATLRLEDPERKMSLNNGSLKQLFPVFSNL